jgi:biopolymer transport protein ExbD
VKFRRTQRAKARIDIINLIDVVFVTLIFFMLATSFTRESHLRVTLPEASPNAADEQETRLELVIASTGSYALSGKVLVNSRIETLLAALGEASGGDVTQPLVITADAKTPHELVVRAMDAAGRLGFSRLSITTRLPQEGD